MVALEDNFDAAHGSEAPADAGVDGARAYERAGQPVAALQLFLCWLLGPHCGGHGVTGGHPAN